MQLLRPVYPGQFHSVRQNLVNVVLVVDLSKTSSLHFLAAPVNNIITRGFPIRFGVVPDVESEEGNVLRLFFYFYLFSIFCFEPHRLIVSCVSDFFRPKNGTTILSSYRQFW